MFDPLTEEAFEAFHAEFQGDTWDICERCGGKCEVNKIGSLMPGEASFIAASRGESEREFRATYLDGIRTPHGVVDVLKMKPGCPFLDREFRCTIKDFKVVLCDVYPVVFEVKGEVVHFSVDQWCPIVRCVPGLSLVFEKRGADALRRLQAPLDWYRAVAAYDHLWVSYSRFHRIRGGDASYRVFSMDEVLQCQANDTLPPDLDVGV